MINDGNIIITDILKRCFGNVVLTPNTISQICTELEKLLGTEYRYIPTPIFSIGNAKYKTKFDIQVMKEAYPEDQCANLLISFWILNDKIDDITFIYVKHNQIFHILHSNKL